MGSALLNTTSEPEFAEAAPDPGAIALPMLRRIAIDGAPELRAKEQSRRGLAADVPAAANAAALRMQVAERLAEHRRRRGGFETAAGRVVEPTRSGNARSARIAAAVAERYANTPSYRAFLAAEAERAIEQARAAAEVAATNARAIADAQQKMLDAFDEDARRQAANERALAAEVQRAARDGNRAAHQDSKGQIHNARPAAMAEGGRVELTLWPDAAREVREEGPRQSAEATRPIATSGSHGAGERVAKIAVTPAARAGGLTVRLYEDAAGAARAHRGITPNVASPIHTNRREYRNEAEAIALDEEIAFRQAPVFEEPAGPPVPLPANLIEFPRQLVAARKARPRIAEGPLREESGAAPGDGQLRIFEVDTAQISTQPIEAGQDAPQWTSIWLDTAPDGAASEDGVNFERGIDPADEAIANAGRPSVPAVQAATITRRFAAGGINLAIAVAGLVVFAAASLALFAKLTSWQIGTAMGQGSTLETLRLFGASIASHTGLEPGQLGHICAGAGVFLILLYQGLFFWFSDATPGMRCTRIGLCTFDDENPARRAVRRRLGAMLLSACALWLGFVWALLDEDRLTWHDRITKMYLRSY